MSRELQTMNQQNKLSLWAGRISELFGPCENRQLGASYEANTTHIYILPPCSTTAASLLNPAGADAQSQWSRCAISDGILTQKNTVLSGYSTYLDKLLKQGVTNSVVCLSGCKHWDSRAVSALSSAT